MTKVRSLRQTKGTALINAKAGDADLDGAVATAVGWEKLAASVAEAERLARPDKADLPAPAARAWPVLHRLGPVFLDAFRDRPEPGGAPGRAGAAAAPSPRFFSPLYGPVTLPNNCCGGHVSRS